MSKQTSEESGREGTLENKSSFVPTHNREAQLIHDIKKKNTLASSLVWQLGRKR